MNTIKVKDTKDEEPLVTDNSKIEVIKDPGYSKLFECGKKFFNNLDATYERACMANAKEKYRSEMYDTITKYNDQHHTPLSNVNIIEAIDQVTREKQSEANNATVDMFCPQRNESENLINKVANLTINDVENDLIN